MTKKNDEIWEILGRYFDQSMSDRDKALLKQWLEENSENRQHLEFMKELQKSEGDANDELFFRKLDVDEDWTFIATHIRKKRSKEKQKKIHTLQRERKKQHAFSGLLKVAALLLVAVTSAYLTMQFAYNLAMEQEKNELTFLEEVSTDRGERANITLGDGTTVSLNVDSKLFISPQFGEFQRRVVLEGEAFFDVMPDPDRPFLIETGGSATEVLGTSFGMRSYENDREVRVVVKSGTLILRNVDDESEETVIGGSSTTVSDRTVLLHAGEMGVFTKKDQRFSTGTADNPDDYFGWMQNRLIFMEAPLEEIIETLERWYDLTIISELSSHDMRESRITLNIKKGHILDVLELIRVSMGIQYEMDDDLIVIKKLQ